MYQYPRFMTYEPQGLIVMFTDIGTGVVLEKGASSRKTGETYVSFPHHYDTNVWTPCADPRPAQKSKRLLSALRKLNDQE